MSHSILHAATRAYELIYLAKCSFFCAQLQNLQNCQQIIFHLPSSSNLLITNMLCTPHQPGFCQTWRPVRSAHVLTWLYCFRISTAADAKLGSHQVSETRPLMCRPASFISLDVLMINVSFCPPILTNVSVCACTPPYIWKPGESKRFDAGACVE